MKYNLNSSVWTIFKMYSEITSKFTNIKWTDEFFCYGQLTRHGGFRLLEGTARCPWTRLFGGVGTLVISSKFAVFCKKGGGVGEISSP